MVYSIEAYDRTVYDGAEYFRIAQMPEIVEKLRC